MKRSLFLATLLCLVLAGLLVSPAIVAQTQLTQKPLPEDIQKEILSAISTNNSAKLQQMLEKGLEPNALILDGKTMLSSAAHGGHVEIVRLLLKYKADPNAVGEGFYLIPPLFSAAENGHTEIVRLLLEVGADTSARFKTKRGQHEKEGQTALMAAIDSQFRNLDLINLLIATAKDINATDVAGNTALKLAERRGLAPVIMLLTQGTFQCPVLTISGPYDVIPVGGKLSFSVNVKGGVADMHYNWSISAGTIVLGQGTPTIQVDTSAKALQGARTITATVELGNYWGDCETSKNFTVAIGN